MIDTESFVGEITVSDGIIHFGIAQKTDIPALAMLYANIAVNSKNYLQKFSPDSEGRFENAGGMFLIHNEESILREMETEDSFFVILKSDAGEIVASLWITRNDPSFVDYVPNRSAFNGDDHQYEAILKAISNKTVAYPREIIISNNYKLSKTALLMVAIFSWGMQKNGYSHALGEIYKVCDYKDLFGTHQVNQLNCKSYHIIDGGVYGLKIGQFLGTFSPRCLSIENYEVTIESHIFALEFSQLLPPVMDYLQDNAIEIKFEGDCTV